MLKFEDYTDDLLLNAVPYLRKRDTLCCDLTPGNLYMWRKDTGLMFCMRGDTLVVRQDIGGQPAFCYPIGSDPDGMIDALIDYVRAEGLALRFYSVDEKTLGKIRSDPRLAECRYAYERQWSDYIYSLSEAIDFSGNKYSTQRNHINKFIKLYGEPRVRFLTQEELPRAHAMLERYRNDHPDMGLLEHEELDSAGELLDAAGKLGLLTACLEVGDEMAALSIAEAAGDTLYIHVEKALHIYEGAYPVIYRGMVRLAAEKYGPALKYVNREDDAGDPGLRISKTRYRPVGMADKYLVHVNTPAARMKSIPVIRGAGVVLTEIRESDKKAYYDLNTDVDNNRYWGYDYREDDDLAQPLTEDTFYNGVMYDTADGDSVNFAVRLTEDGPMAGEALLWNFTYSGQAELGIRLMPEYQGSGRGTGAFSALAAYARDVLGLRCVAKCFKENAASAAMILSSGFEKTGEDGTYLYFALK